MSSNMSQEERHEMAERGKAMFARTISSENATVSRGASSPTRGESPARPRHDSQENYNHARVEETFDPVADGFCTVRGEDGFLPLEEDDVVEILEKGDSGWWEGRFWDPMRGKATGPRGRFPSAYVVPIPDPFDPWNEAPAELEEAMAARAEDEAKKAHQKKWRNANRLFLALLEMVTNEHKYVSNLWLCLDLYVKPIDKQFGADFVGSLFPTWQSIARTHEKLLKSLVEASQPSFRVLQRMAGLPGGSGNTKKRESLAAAAEGAKASSLELRAIGEELDAVQEWHDAHILDREMELSDAVFDAFQAALSQWAVALSKRLESQCESLTVSSVYIRNYNDAIAKIDEWSTSMPSFAQAVDRIAQTPAARGLGLASFLIKPVQHICRYPLLIREVHRHCPEDGTQEAVLQCQIRLIEVTTEVNSMQDESGAGGAGMTLADLRSSLKFKSPQEESSCLTAIDKVTAQLMTQGPLKLVQAPTGSSRETKGTNQRCFLLNSTLIVTDQYQNLLGKERYKVRAIIPMDRVGVVGPMESQRRSLFGLSRISSSDADPLKGDVLHKSDKWIFEASSPAERDAWLRNLEQALSITRGVSNRVKNASHGASQPSLAAALSSGRRPAPQPSGGEEPKYNSLKNKQEQLQAAHPSFLLQLQKEDPLINELQSRLKSKRAQDIAKA